MLIEDIISEWKEDSKYDRTELGEEALRCSTLHAKYIEMYFREQSLLLKLNNDYQKQRKARWEYWSGKLDAKTIRENGWDPQPLSILKADLEMYLQTDEKISHTALRVELQEEKIKMIDMIIRHISNRGFSIKTAVDYERFKSGL